MCVYEYIKYTCVCVWVCVQHASQKWPPPPKKNKNKEQTNTILKYTCVMYKCFMFENLCFCCILGEQIDIVY